MKTILFISSLFFMSLSDVNEILVERDCDAEASRVFDLAYYYTGDTNYAFIHSAKWMSNCNLDNSTSAEISAPLLN